MKIGIVCYPTYGGSGVVATELGKSLAERGHIIHFITYEQPVRLNYFDQNIFYHRVNPGDYPVFDFLPYETALTSKLVEVTQFEKLDLLHVHYAIPHASSAFMAQQILAGLGVHIPFITTLHGTDITLVGQEASYEPVVRFSINKSDGVTCVSDFLRQETLRYFKSENPIEVIYNFIDLTRFKELEHETIRKCLSPNDEKIIIHLSNFRKVKRIDDVIKAFHIVKQKIAAKLLLVGDGPERSNMERLVRSLNLTQDVTFLGKQESVEKILPIGDLFMIPSETESFGLAALEAMACGLPVIATRLGGLPELVDDGENGFLCELGDYESMAERALFLLTDADRLCSFRKSAIKRAKDFDIQTIVPKYEAYYLEVLERSRRLSAVLA